MATSIKLGTVTASLLIKKLTSYPKQNGLAKALREIDRIERTLFMLDWCRDPDLLQRVQVGLNKREAHNALARAVFRHRLSEVRVRGLGPRQRANVADGGGHAVRLGIYRKSH